MTDPQATPRLPQAWRYTAERAVAFFSVLCLNWHDGNVCTRPAGHKGKHRHSLKVAWTVVPPLTEARQIASDYATALNDCERAHDALVAALTDLLAAMTRYEAGWMTSMTGYSEVAHVKSQARTLLRQLAAPDER